MKPQLTRSTLLTLLATLALAACEKEDKTAPPAPVVDPLESPTPATKVSLTGSAEFNAKIRITGGAAEATATSDAFTARWRAEVELRPDAENPLSVTATDAAGNTSLATVVAVVQASSKATSVRLSFGAPVARAGELVALATVVLDQYGHEMPEAPVTFEVSPPLAATFTVPGSAPAVTKEQGVLAGTRQFVAYDLAGARAGDDVFTLKAKVGTVEDSAALVVRPAPALAFKALAFQPAGTTLSLVAGQDAPYSYEVVDLYGNVTEGPVSAYTSAPGAVVVDDGVSGSGKVTRLTAAGSYALAFYIAGAGQKGSLAFDVGTAPGAFVDLSASSTLTSPQSKVQLFARVRDAFGNPIACTAGNTAAVAFAAAGALGTAATPDATTCFNGAFRTTFTFASEDTWAVTATFAPTGATAVTGTVFVTVLAFDNTPPRVAIQNVKVGGAPCDAAARTPNGCDAANGDTVTFDVAASDNTALAEVGYGIFFETTQRPSTRTVFVAANQATATLSFRFQVNAGAEVAPLVATAVDRAGNTENSAQVNLYVATGVPLGARTLDPYVSGGSINQPQDVAFSANGDLFIVNSNSNSLLKVPAGTTTPQVVASGGGGVQGDSLTVAGLGGSERLFASDNSNGRLLAFDLSGANRTTLSSSASFTGLATLQALPSRGWVELGSGGDGATITLSQNGTTEVYELDSNTSCSPAAGKTCVAVAGGASGAQKASAVQQAMTTASALVRAGVAGSQLTLESRSLGESSTVPVTLSVGGGLSRSAGTLVEGHDQEVWAGNDNDTLVRRHFITGSTHGTFDLGLRQGGLAVRDVWGAAPNNPALLDLMVYATRRNNGNAASLLEGLELLTQAVAPNAPVSSVASRFTLSGTNVGSPQVSFSQPWDVVLAPNGCLLVSDAGNGSIYAVDTRAGRTFTNIPVERIARNLPGPRGMALDPAGVLFIAGSGGNAVFRLTPTPDTTDCF